MRVEMTAAGEIMTLCQLSHFISSSLLNEFIGDIVPDVRIMLCAAVLSEWKATAEF